MEDTDAISWLGSSKVVEEHVQKEIILWAQWKISSAINLFKELKENMKIRGDERYLKNQMEFLDMKNKSD